MAKKKMTLDLTLPIFQIKISLQHLDPPVWRRVQTDDCSLADLHNIIQIAMGWEDMHMHAFVIADEQYGRGGDCEYDSRYVSLSEVVVQGHTRFRYDYDFGDDWEHSIEIEKTLAAEEGVKYPRCVAGERACPLEDSGGSLATPTCLKNSKTPSTTNTRKPWNGLVRDFRPRGVRPERTNEDLYHLRRWLGKRQRKEAPSGIFQGRFGAGEAWSCPRPIPRHSFGRLGGQNQANRMAYAHCLCRPLDQADT